MCPQEIYEEALAARIIPAKRKVQARKSVVDEILSFGRALCTVVGKIKECQLECKLQDIPPLSNPVAMSGSESDGYMLILVVKDKQMSFNAVQQKSIITVLSCWFPYGACFPCEIRTSDNVYKCASKAKVKDILLELSKSCLVPILATFEEKLQTRSLPSFAPHADDLEGDGPTGNVEPAEGEPTACNDRLS